MQNQSLLSEVTAHLFNVLVEGSLGFPLSFMEYSIISVELSHDSMKICLFDKVTFVPLLLENVKVTEKCTLKL